MFSTYLVEDYKISPHTKFGSPRPYGYGQEDFFFTKYAKTYKHAKFKELLRPCFSTKQIFLNNFFRGAFKDHPCKKNWKSDEPFLTRRFFKVLTIYGHGGQLGYVTKFFFNNIFFPWRKDAPHEIWLKLAQWFRRKIWSAQVR